MNEAYVGADALASASGVRVLWSIRGLDMTIGELCACAAAYGDEHPDEDVYMDGDLYAVVARRTRA